MIVKSEVKKAAAEVEMRCSADFLEALALEVKKLVAKAAARAKANKRGTLKPQDL